MMESEGKISELDQIKEIIDLPPAFDAEAFRNFNSEFAHLNDADARDYYKRFGIILGMRASVADERSGIMPLVNAERSILEVGPFTAPALFGDKVKYLDAFNREQLISIARTHGLDPKRVPDIDYVSLDGDFGIVDQKFDAAFGSHSIEHQPDFIEHLRNMAGILTERGRYYIICPDKRYCFDHFVPETTAVDVISAYALRVKLHQARSHIGQRLFMTHNEPERHWNGDHGRPRYEAEPETIPQLFDGLRDDHGYIDQHAWQFTPSSFYEIAKLLYDLKLIDFYPERVYNTPKGKVEFIAVLKKIPRSIDDNIIRENQEINYLGPVVAQIKIEKNNENEKIQDELCATKSDLLRILNSNSWKITRPLRYVRRFLKK